MKLKEGNSKRESHVAAHGNIRQDTPNASVVIPVFFPSNHACPSSKTDARKPFESAAPQNRMPETTAPYTWHINLRLPLSSSSNEEPRATLEEELPERAETDVTHKAHMGRAQCGFAASGALRGLKHELRRGMLIPLHFRGASFARACISPRGSGARHGGLGPLGAVGVLNGVAILWGSQHAVMKMAVEAGATPSGLTTSRFLIASALLSPFLTKITRAELEAGLELGAWSFLGFALQTVGLESTTAARSGFLLYLNVKLVPLLGLLLGRRPPRSAWLAAAVALAGTFMLAGDGHAWASGDSLSVAAAAASAMFILRLEARARNARPVPLAGATVAVTAAFAALWAVCTGTGGPAEWLPGGTILAALYLGAVPTALATVLQTRAQQSVSAERAAVIYAMDPVYGALFAYWLLGESFGARGIVGAMLIFAAAFISNQAVGDAEKASESFDSNAKGNGVAKGTETMQDKVRPDVAPLGAPALRATDRTIVERLHD